MPMTVQRRLAAPRALITKSTATTASITPAANVIARAMAVWTRDVAPSHGTNQQSGCRHGSPTGCLQPAGQLSKGSRQPRLVVLRQYDRIGSIKQGSIALGNCSTG